MDGGLLKPVATDVSGLMRLERWVLRIGAFGLPLVVSTQSFDQFVLPKLLLTQLLVVVLALLFVGRFFFEPSRSWKRTPIDLPLIALIASAALSTMLSVNQTTALFGTYGRYEGLLTIATYGAFFWLTSQALRTRKDAAILVRVLLASGYAVALATVFQAVYGTPGTPGAFTLCLVRPYATMGNALPLATFLAMLLPLAVSELFSVRSLAGRIIAGNLAIVIGIALWLTLTRGAWLGAALGLGVVIVGSRVFGRSAGVVTPICLLTLAVAVLTPITVAAADSQPDPCLARIASLAQPQAGSSGIRLHVWADTIRLIESSPFVGYGPENFALVYPRFQSGDWQPGDLFDKAHADLLQIAATQGLVGVAAEVWLWLAFVRAFLSTQRVGLGLGAFGGWLAYEVSLQFGFSWVPSSIPFWIFTGAALAMWTTGATNEVRLPRRQRAVLLPAILAIVLALGVIVTGVVRSYPADVAFYQSLRDAANGQHDAALTAISTARRLNANEWVYAAEEGNLDLDLSAAGSPGPRADWTAARKAYEDAVRLGTFNPAVFRDLALVDYRVGDQQAAEAAARRAVELYRFDPANRAVLDFVSRQRT